MAHRLTTSRSPVRTTPPCGPASTRSLLYRPCSLSPSRSARKRSMTACFMASIILARHVRRSHGRQAPELRGSTAGSLESACSNPAPWRPRRVTRRQGARQWRAGEALARGSSRRHGDVVRALSSSNARCSRFPRAAGPASRGRPVLCTKAPASETRREEFAQRMKIASGLTPRPDERPDKHGRRPCGACAAAIERPVGRRNTCCQDAHCGAGYRFEGAPTAASRRPLQLAAGREVP